MTTNTNTKQTRQTDSTDTSTDDESNQETEITLPSDLERGPDDKYRCPVDGCDFSGRWASGLPHHYYYAHDTTIPSDLFGQETWLAYLEQEHVEKGRMPGEIAESFESHIGKEQIRDDLNEADLYVESVGNMPEAAKILLHPDVETIADAQREAAKRRGEL